MVLVKDDLKLSTDVSVCVLTGIELVVSACVLTGIKLVVSVCVLTGIELVVSVCVLTGIKLVVSLCVLTGIKLVVYGTSISSELAGTLNDAAIEVDGATIVKGTVLLGTTVVVEAKTVVVVSLIYIEVCPNLVDGNVNSSDIIPLPSSVDIKMKVVYEVTMVGENVDIDGNRPLTEWI